MVATVDFLRYEHFVEENVSINVLITADYIIYVKELCIETIATYRIFFKHF